MWGILWDRIVFYLYHLVSCVKEGMEKQKELRVWVEMMGRG